MENTPPAPPKPKKKTLDFMRKLDGNPLLALPFENWPDAAKAEAYTLEKFDAAKKRGAIPSHWGDDKIYTPDDLAAAIVYHFQPRGSILEPFRGAGAFTRAFDSYNKAHAYEGTERLTIIDSMEIAPPDDTPSTDFFTDGPPQESYDWIITNHPWSRTVDTLRHCFDLRADIVLLIYMNAMYTNHRLDFIEDAGYYFAEVARVDRPKVWRSMGMQLAAVHLRPVDRCQDVRGANFCRNSKISYHNPEPPKLPKLDRKKAKK